MVSRQVNAGNEMGAETLTDQDDKKRSPKDYAYAVQRQSKRVHEKTLFPGVHYRSLALFLNNWRPSQPTQSLVTKDKAQPAQSYPLVIVHDLFYSRKDPKRITSFDSVHGLDALSDHPLPRSGAGQLLFLRGYPSPDWVNLIGSKYRVDPEIFRRHLQFDTKEDLFDLPSLPSASQNIIRLSIPSIGNLSSTTAGRAEAERALQGYCNGLGTRTNFIGESIVRKFSSHDDQHCSIEQDIRISVLRRGNGWIAIILLDFGKDLDDGPSGPGSVTAKLASDFENFFFPVIQFESKVVFSASENDKTPRTEAEKTSTAGVTQLHAKRRCMQSASLLSEEAYGEYLDQAVMKSDAFYAMGDLFSFAANAENQFLNCLRLKVRADIERLSQQRDLQPTLNNFVYHRGIVREHVQYLDRMVQIMTNRAGLKWPSMKPQPIQAEPISKNGAAEKRDDSPSNQTELRLAELQQRQIQVANAGAASLLQDYEAQRDKANSLVQLYQEGIKDIRATTAVAETRKAYAQAEAVARLTFLAFIFIPLSFTTSFFGMNFKELGNQLSIYVWFAVTVPIFMVAILLCYWEKVVSSIRSATAYLPSVSYRKVRGKPTSLDNGPATFA